MSKPAQQPPSPIDVRLMAIRYAARDVNVYEFSSVAGIPLPPAEPGAHVGLHLPNGMLRHYSLINVDDTPVYQTAVKREASGRGGSRFIHDALRVGARLRIDPPRNNFRLREDAPHSLLIAGGIGITPLVAMAQRLQRLGRSWTLHYACRSREEAAFLDFLQTLPSVHTHFDAETGRVMDLVPIVASAQSATHLYCCGPAPMLRAFQELTSALPREQVHVEYFTAKPLDSDPTEFVVKLARTGLAVNVPAGTSILHALRDAGVTVSSSCEEGVCGTCETRVLDGVPDHRDSILSDAERAAGHSMMICCSRSLTPELVLDL